MPSEGAAAGRPFDPGDGRPVARQVGDRPVGADAARGARLGPVRRRPARQVAPKDRSRRQDDEGGHHERGRLHRRGQSHDVSDLVHFLIFLFVCLFFFFIPVFFSLLRLLLVDLFILSLSLSLSDDEKNGFST